MDTIVKKYEKNITRKNLLELLDGSKLKESEEVKRLIQNDCKKFEYIQDFVNDLKHNKAIIFEELKPNRTDKFCYKFFDDNIGMIQIPLLSYRR